jgi:hypothetical protein
MIDEQPDDPVLDKQIHDEAEAIVALFAAVYPPPLLDELRRVVRLGLRGDPYARDLLNAVRPRATPQETNKVDLRAFADDGKKAGAGGR